MSILSRDRNASNALAPPNLSSHELEGPVVLWTCFGPWFQVSYPSHQDLLRRRTHETEDVLSIERKIERKKGRVFLFETGKGNRVPRTMSPSFFHAPKKKMEKNKGLRWVSGKGWRERVTARGRGKRKVHRKGSRVGFRMRKERSLSWRGKGASRLDGRPSSVEKRGFEGDVDRGVPEGVEGQGWRLEAFLPGGNDDVPLLPRSDLVTDPNRTG